MRHQTGSARKKGATQSAIVRHSARRPMSSEQGLEEPKRKSEKGRKSRARRLHGGPRWAPMICVQTGSVCRCPTFRLPSLSPVPRQCIQSNQCEKYVSAQAAQAGRGGSSCGPGTAKAPVRKTSSPKIQSCACSTCGKRGEMRTRSCVGRLWHEHKDCACCRGGG